MMSPGEARAVSLSIARSRFWRADVRWFGPRGIAELSQPAIAWCLRGASQGDRDLYVLVNGSSEPVSFVMQDTAGAWQVAVDTSRSPPDDIELECPRGLPHPSYVAGGRSIVVLVREH